MGATMTTFRVANGVPAPAVAPKSRMSGANGLVAPVGAGVGPAAGGVIPLSARKAQPLDLATVERRGHGIPHREPPKTNRMFGLQEAPTFYPTEDEFREPLQYIQKIGQTASNYGIAKIVPPAGWKPPFAIDTEVSHIYRMPGSSSLPMWSLPMMIGVTTHWTSTDNLTSDSTSKRDDKS